MIVTIWFLFYRYNPCYNLIDQLLLLFRLVNKFFIRYKLHLLRKNNIVTIITWTEVNKSFQTQQSMYAHDYILYF